MVCNCKRVKNKKELEDFLTENNKEYKPKFFDRLKMAMMFLVFQTVYTFYGLCEILKNGGIRTKKIKTEKHKNG